MLEVPFVVDLAPLVRGRLQPDPGPIPFLLNQQRIGLDVGNDAVPWMEMSPGVKYCAVVSFRPSLSSSDLSPKEIGDWMSNST